VSSVDIAPRSPGRLHHNKRICVDIGALCFASFGLRFSAAMGIFVQFKGRFPSHNDASLRRGWNSESGVLHAAKHRQLSVFRRQTLGLYRCGCREVWLGRRANRLKPPANVDLSMRLSTEMTSSGRAGGVGVPLVNSELSVTALDHEPVNWTISDPGANFATVLLKSCHGVHPV
jgi:hypothetical protein